MLYNQHFQKNINMETKDFNSIPNMGIKQSSSYQYGFVREVKLSKKTSLEGYMHIYEYGMHQHLGSTNNIELGDCNDLFSPYFNNKLGFSCMIGMYALLLRYYASHFAKYLFQPQKLKREITDWLVEGDLHTLIINMIYNHPHKGKFEEALRKLEFRIIGNSIRSGIKDVSFWKTDYIMKKLIISNQELNDFLSSISSPAKNDQKDSESQHHVFVPSDENMGANSLFMQVETEGVNERSSRGNNTYYINTGSINNYNNCKVSFTQVNNYNQIVFIKTEYKIPGDIFHAEQPNETHSSIRQCEPQKYDKGEVKDFSSDYPDFKKMNSFTPITDKGPDLNKLYSFLINKKSINELDLDIFEKIVSHACFHPLYRNGVKKNLLYTIRRLKSYYPEDWFSAVIKDLGIKAKRVTQNMPNKDFTNDFPSLDFKPKSVFRP